MIRLIGAALAVALTLTLLAACGGQSTPEKGETAEFYSETHDEDGFDTVFDADFSEGHGAGKDHPSAYGAVEEGLRIVGSALYIKLSDHLLVTGQLNIPTQESIGNPHQGIKPMERQDSKT